MITSQQVEVTHLGTGNVTVFAFPFYAIEAAALKVYRGGILLSQSGNYTVQGLRQNAGGTITFAVAPGAGVAVRIVRDTPRIQGQTYDYQTDFPAKVTELALDRAICIAQELAARIAKNEGDIATLQTQMAEVIATITDVLPRLGNLETWRDSLSATLATIMQFYQGTQQAVQDLQAMINEYGGVPGQFTTFVYKQSETKPATPTQGGVMIPPGWSDVPTASGVWWMSTGIVGFGNVPPASWTEPVKVTAEDGEPGADGTYTDFKYAKSGSKTVAPAISASAVNPGAGWTDAPPALASGEYMWMTKATKVAGTGAMAGPAPYWSAPVRISGEEGLKGDKGDKGDTATIVVEPSETITGAPGTSAKVENLGNPQAAYLRFTIPRGNTGATGATGAKGDKGDPGNDATATLTAQGTFDVPCNSGGVFTSGTVYTSLGRYVVRGGWVYVTIRAAFGSVVKSGSSTVNFDASAIPAAYRPGANLTNPNTTGRLMGHVWAENLADTDHEGEVFAVLESDGTIYVYTNDTNTKNLLTTGKVVTQTFFYFNFHYPLLT
ncbi:hypothetical protein OpiT1DRAFT_03832 [Opitutaceae bacterium TAV1]|nr:hypothetical protein OpiT1DRAFT_03832 [Opitutaceae bacterium TAV1]